MCVQLLYQYDINVNNIILYKSDNEYFIRYIDAKNGFLHHYK